MELTPLRLRVGVAIFAIILCVGIAAFIIAIRSVSRPTSGGDGNSALLEQNKLLQEELRKKELALVVQEKRLKEVQESLKIPITPKVGSQAATKETPQPSLKSKVSESGTDSQDGGSLASIQNQTSPRSGSPPTISFEPVPDRRMPRSDQAASDSSGADSHSSEILTETGQSKAHAPIINFDAQDVTALSENPNSGTLTFRLIKDQPDVRFSGYLFVFVEMVDNRGENIIYVYPKSTRLGEEDLPSDYKDGESLSFKYNSRVELPYGDMRMGASLARVSILLYGENGKIVFQRSFDRKEVKMVGARGSHADSTSRQKSSEKRRAL